MNKQLRALRAALETMITKEETFKSSLAEEYTERDRKERERERELVVVELGLVYKLIKLIPLSAVSAIIRGPDQIDFYPGVAVVVAMVMGFSWHHHHRVDGCTLSYNTKYQRPPGSHRCLIHSH